MSSPKIVITEAQLQSMNFKWKQMNTEAQTKFLQQHSTTNYKWNKFVIKAKNAYNDKWESHGDHN